MQIIHARHGLPFQSDNHVALAQVCAFPPDCHPPLKAPERSCLFRQIVEAHDAAVDRHSLSGDSDVTPTNSAITQQTTGHELCRIDADSKADSLRRQDGRSVDANDLTRSNRSAGHPSCLDLGQRLSG